MHEAQKTTIYNTYGVRPEADAALSQLRATPGHTIGSVFISHSEYVHEPTDEVARAVCVTLTNLWKAMDDGFRYVWRIQEASTHFKVLIHNRQNYMVHTHDRLLAPAFVTAYKHDEFSCLSDRPLPFIMIEVTILQYSQHPPVSRALGTQNGAVVLAKTHEPPAVKWQHVLNRLTITHEDGYREEHDELHGVRKRRKDGPGVDTGVLCPKTSRNKEEVVIVQYQGHVYTLEVGSPVEMIFSDEVWYPGCITWLGGKSKAESRTAVIDFEDGDRCALLSSYTIYLRMHHM